MKLIIVGWLLGLFFIICFLCHTISPLPQVRHCHIVGSLSFCAYLGGTAVNVLSDILFAALVSRQFVDMSRIRIESFLAAFPKLVGTGKQHTYVETENVRYVYQPIESLYLLLVTNKQSNILEDLETLRLLSKLVCFLA